MYGHDWFLIGARIQTKDCMHARQTICPGAPVPSPPLLIMQIHLVPYDQQRTLLNPVTYRSFPCQEFQAPVFPSTFSCTIGKGTRFPDLLWPSSYISTHLSCSRGRKACCAMGMCPHQNPAPQHPWGRTKLRMHP